MEEAVAESTSLLEEVADSELNSVVLPNRSELNWSPIVNANNSPTAVCWDCTALLRKQLRNGIIDTNTSDQADRGLNLSHGIAHMYGRSSAWRNLAMRSSLGLALQIAGLKIMRPKQQLCVKIRKKGNLRDSDLLYR